MEPETDSAAEISIFFSPAYVHFEGNFPLFPGHPLSRFVVPEVGEENNFCLVLITNCSASKTHKKRRPEKCPWTEFGWEQEQMMRCKLASFQAKNLSLTTVDDKWILQEVLGLLDDRWFRKWTLQVIWPSRLENLQMFSSKFSELISSLRFTF